MIRAPAIEDRLDQSTKEVRTVERIARREAPPSALQNNKGGPTQGRTHRRKKIIKGGVELGGIEPPTS